MPRNGTGTYTLPYNWNDDLANGITIQAGRMMGQQDDVATALTNSIAKDGQTAFTGNQSMGNNKITNLGNATDAQDAIPTAQVQNSSLFNLGTSLGVADAYTAAAVPAITAYEATMSFRVKIHATNATTTPTLQLNGIGNPALDGVIKKIDNSGAEVALEAGELDLGGIYDFQRNSANNAWILMNVPVPIYTPVGSVINFAASTPPAGFLECNGATLLRATYPDLFAVIGTTFGSTDSANFLLPDLRGEFVRGFDNGRGIDTGRVFGSSQLDAFQNFTSTVGISRNMSQGGTGAFSQTAVSSSLAGSGSTPAQPFRTDFDASLAPGVRTAAETRPRNIALIYCIRY